MQQPIGNEWVKNYLLYCRESLPIIKLLRKASLAGLPVLL